MSKIEAARLNLVHACLALSSDLIADSFPGNSEEWVDESASALASLLHDDDDRQNPDGPLADEDRWTAYNFRDGS